MSVWCHLLDRIMGPSIREAYDCGVRDGVGQLRGLLAELVDPDPCWFDHNGGCQAHGYISLQPGQTCPVQDAKSILAASS